MRVCEGEVLITTPIDIVKIPRLYRASTHDGDDNDGDDDDSDLPIAAHL